MKRKLIEVALPLKEINEESAREKSIRHGHPSTLHLWWARRPLAACRAVLFAQLVDDPSSHPDRFPTEEDQDRERERLFGIIRELVKWKNRNDERVLRKAREEILRSTGGNPPPILDPFAGGGSIPLEAQRLGLKAHASDLNPVAVLINKALIEIPPKFAGQPPVFPGAAGSRTEWPGATGLAEDVRCYGQWMRDEAEKRIGHLYPKAKLSDGTEAPVIAWIWARTVRCPNPACGIQMPLVRSWWLGKKKGKEAYVVPHVKDGRVVFDIGHDASKAPTKNNDGTVRRTGAVCIGCGSAVPLAYIREEGKAKRIGTQLMAIVAEGKRRRIYLPPNEEHERAADVPRPEDVPETDIPYNPRYLTTTNYGMTQHADLFTNRQLIALTTFSDLVQEVRRKILNDALAADMVRGERLADGGTGAEAYADSVATYLALGVSRMADISNALCRWENTKTQVRNLFTRQAISMLWDFAETQPFGDAAGGFLVSVGNLAKSIYAAGPRCGVAVQGNAAARQYPGFLVATDPPYYDNVGYADLSDFFYVWLRRSLAQVYPTLLGTVLTPKSDELVADPFRHGGSTKAQQFFEEGFEQVFERIREGTPEGYPISVFYAFKQAETDERGHASTGWETLLEGMLRAGWSVTATWPIRTELDNRMRGLDSNALASSIVLACRPRGMDAGMTDRRGFIAALRAELPDAVRKLQQGSIAPVDLAQAAIGPGMAVFSRYAQVMEPDGSPMRVRTALALINQVLAEVLSDQEGDFDADTRWCVKWFETRGFDKGLYGDAETLAKAVNTSVAGLDRAGVLRSRAGKVQLYAPAELPGDYDPRNDDRISLWEVVLHLAKRLDEKGADAAGQLMAAAGQRVDLDAAKELAYLLFSICERRGWAQTALLFNSLGSFWTDLEQAARKAVAQGYVSVQGSLDYDDED
ncbi:hypothetical protein TH66_17730 [Carbonactinospora thermoautotrophica]|uniref:DUF1156 domain-containing protein n=1 Tax=Carbonactinospora thermoautotrophica TaxID=1469144 RepID=A0A132NAG5_9ACTN|nr:DUF1156 domain-containing protein [Carbonactinospora thermoautotrophica]KWW97477.1 hypothetical protein TH66_17730 [Carbonactinospora thermoautotrophica]KWX07108.1 hypothetical protein TR74_19830 [Carbonactinospora thermoautotrophica]